MSILMNDLFNRIKNLKEFEVTLAMPEDFMFQGVVPYDMQINNKTATVTLLALTYEEAQEKVFEYFYK